MLGMPTPPIIVPGIQSHLTFQLSIPREAAGDSSRTHPCHPCGRPGLSCKILASAWHSLSCLQATKGGTPCPQPCLPSSACHFGFKYMKMNLGGEKISRFSNVDHIHFSRSFVHQLSASSCWTQPTLKMPSPAPQELPQDTLGHPAPAVALLLCQEGTFSLPSFSR